MREALLEQRLGQASGGGIRVAGSDPSIGWEGTGDEMQRRAQLLLDVDPEQSAHLYRQAIKWYRMQGAAEEGEVARLSVMLGRAMSWAGRHEAAAELLGHTLATMRTSRMDETHPDLLRCERFLAWALIGSGRPGAARDLLGVSIERHLRRWDSDFPDVLEAEEFAAIAERDLGLFASAERRLVACVETIGSRSSFDRRYLVQDIERLVSVYEAWHAAEPTVGHDAKAGAWRTRLAMLQAEGQ